jgi:hypothetical protein
MDRFEAPLIANYVNRLSRLDRCWKQTPEGEDEYYALHAPKPMRSLPFVSVVAAIGIAALALGFVSS